MTAGDAVRMLGISRRFGSVQALHGADFALAAGEIHALLGENGAGKTTLMNVLYGITRPDAGTIEIAGEAVSLRRPAEALARGIGMVQQHHAVVDTMSVAENVWLGMPGLFTDIAGARALIARLGEETGLVLDPDAPAGSLSIGLRQRLEIVKALARQVRVLILDEPTSSLAPAESLALLTALRSLRDRGVAIVLVTHKLRDVAAAADRITVLRRGETVLAGPGSLGAGELAQAMIGAPLDPVGRPPRAAPAGEPVIEVTSPGVSFAIHAGEILALAAVEGNGQRELLRQLAGVERGELTVRCRGTVAFIPEDRQREALIPAFSIADNLALGGRAFGTRELRHQAERAIAEFAITAPGPATAVAQLSGGNQQRVVLARALAHKPALILAENPTHGLDVQAAQDVLRRLRRAAAGGAAVLLYSTDLDEVMEIADRVAVMAGGLWIDVAPDLVNREHIGSLMLGA